MLLSPVTLFILVILFHFLAHINLFLFFLVFVVRETRAGAHVFGAAGHARAIEADTGLVHLVFNVIDLLVVTVGIKFFLALLGLAAGAELDWGLSVAGGIAVGETVAFVAGRVLVRLATFSAIERPVTAKETIKFKFSCIWAILARLHNPMTKKYVCQDFPVKSSFWRKQKKGKEEKNDFYGIIIFPHMSISSFETVSQTFSFSSHSLSNPTCVWPPSHAKDFYFPQARITYIAKRKERRGNCKQEKKIFPKQQKMRHVRKSWRHDIARPRAVKVANILEQKGEVKSLEICFTTAPGCITGNWREKNESRGKVVARAKLSRPGS